MRKSLLNCVSIKKLNYHDFDFYSKKSGIFYGIVAYVSSSKQNTFERELESYLDEIPESLRPNLIYINDRGVYTPTLNGSITFSYDNIANCKTPYKLFSGKNRDAQDILLFLSSIVDSCTKVSKSSFSYCNYIISPIIYEQKLKADSETPPKFYANRGVIWDGEYVCGGYAKGFRIKCSCGKTHSFSYPIITSEKNFEVMKAGFKENGVTVYEPSKKYQCECGLSLDMGNKIESNEDEND